MGSYENTYERIMTKPTAKDITPDELKSFLKHYGFNLKRTKGSHFFYEYTTRVRNHQFPIPMHNPIKPSYIDMIREIINEEEDDNGEL